MCHSDSCFDEIGSQGWQRIDQKDIPCTLKSLAPNEIIVSFNIVSYSTTWKEEITSFRVNYDNLLTSPTLVSELLSQTSVAFFTDHAEMIYQSIFDKFKSQELTVYNRVATVNMTLVCDDDDDDDDNEDESRNDSELDAGEGINNASASVEFLEGFEVVEIRGGGNLEGVSEHCSICLEDFSEGSKVSKMPCSHLYHRTCIFQWLVKGDSCPLCRGIPKRVLFS